MNLLLLFCTMCVHKLNKLPSFDIGETTDTCSYLSLENQVTSDSNDLSVIQLNIRGLYSKLGELNHLLDHSFTSKHPDIVLLCETWLTPPSPKPTLPGYQIERTDHLHKKGGGMGVLVSTRCKYKRRKDLEQFNNHSLGSCFIEISNLRDQIVIGSLYWPPNSSIQDFIASFNEILSINRRQGKQLVLVLDHNFDFLKEAIHLPTHTFLEAIYDGGLVPMITKLTRITPLTASLIDNILVDQRLQTCASSGILIYNISDHLPCYTILANICPSRKKKLK